MTKSTFHKLLLEVADYDANKKCYSIHRSERIVLLLKSGKTFLLSNIYDYYDYYEFIEKEEVGCNKRTIIVSIDDIAGILK